MVFQLPLRMISKKQSETRVANHSEFCFFLWINRLFGEFFQLVFWPHKPFLPKHQNNQLAHHHRCVYFWRDENIFSFLMLLVSGFCKPKKLQQVSKQNRSRTRLKVLCQLFFADRKREKSSNTEKFITRG